MLAQPSALSASPRFRRIHKTHIFPSISQSLKSFIQFSHLDWEQQRWHIHTHSIITWSTVRWQLYCTGWGPGDGIWRRRGSWWRRIEGFWDWMLYKRMGKVSGGPYFLLGMVANLWEESKREHHERQSLPEMTKHQRWHRGQSNF